MRYTYLEILFHRYSMFIVSLFYMLVHIGNTKYQSYGGGTY